ncbi:hypothetical protein AM613_09355 [Listeria monocytogenes]|nr:hypothetical protein [Listeria monocytogenes]
MKIEKKTLVFEKEGVAFKFKLDSLDSFIVTTDNDVSFFRLSNSKGYIKTGKIPFDTSIKIGNREFFGINVSPEFGAKLEKTVQDYKDEIHARTDAAFDTVNIEGCVIQKYSNIYTIDIEEHHDLQRLDHDYYRKKMTNFLADYTLKYKPTAWDGDYPPFSYYTLEKKEITNNKTNVLSKEKKLAEKMYTDAETMSDEEFEDVYDLPREYYIL